MNGILTPTLILDQNKCMANIERMVLKAKNHGLLFRPHFKTHASAEIGNWFRDFGVTSITVSSVRMAQYFARNGWQDITIAFPVNILEIGEINLLADNIKLGLLVESTESVEFLKKHLHSKVDIYIEIDSGYPRTGIEAGDYDKIEDLIKRIKSPKLRFRGFLTHAGHTYSATSADKIIQIHHTVLETLKNLRHHFFTAGDDFLISTGDTPSCSLAGRFDGIDEIRPGNFVFYDCMQQGLGSCDWDQIAVAMYCPVIAKYPDRNQMVIYGGAVQFSKEFIIGPKGERIFGRVVKIGVNGWKEPIENAYVSSLSQEHGIISAPAGVIHSFSIGDLVAVLPVHSCLTAHAMKHYRTLDSKIVHMIDL